jgi:hypothetical protein
VPFTSFIVLVLLLCLGTFSFCSYLDTQYKVVIIRFNIIITGCLHGC